MVAVILKQCRILKSLADFFLNNNVHTNLTRILRVRSNINIFENSSDVSNVQPSLRTSELEQCFSDLSVHRNPFFFLIK